MPPVVFAKAGEKMITSYDYFDIAEGTGVQNLKGFVTKNSGGLSYAIGKTSVYSSVIETEGIQGNISGGTAYKLLDLDFDLSSLNAPRTVKGKIYVNYCVQTGRSAGSGTVTSYQHLKLRKWDGTTETEIANTQTTTFGGSNTNDPTPFCTVIEVPKTRFKTGETIRLTIECWSIGNTVWDTIYHTLGTDPLNRDGTRIIPSTDTGPETITQLNIYMPFALDL